MDKIEVQDLLEEIKKEYPNFDVSVENENRLYKYLSDFPFKAALKNVEDHIKTNRFPPTIADIRGRLGDLQDSQRSKEETASYFAQLDASRLCNVPPPTGYWDHLRKLVRGEAVE